MKLLIKTVAAIALLITQSEAKSKNLSPNYDHHPSVITNSDLKLVKNFDKKAYSAVEKRTKRVDIAKIYHFIINNKRYIHDYNRVVVKVAGRAGLRTRRGYTDTVDTSRKKGYYNAYLEVSYPLYDKKHQKQINNEKLKYNLQVLKKVEEYADAVVAVENQKELLDFLRMKQRLIKTEVKTGIKYRDERIQILDKMMLAKMKLREAIEARDTTKIYLLNLTTKPTQLEKML